MCVNKYSSVSHLLLTIIFATFLRFVLCFDPDLNRWFARDFDGPDMGLNVSQLIASKGYPVEEHWIQTEDGYIIGIQRIPHGRLERWSRSYYGGKAKKVVFLMHGIAETSTDWVWNFPNQSLGFILADHGYDVWLGNVRGNTYGMRHVNLSTDSEEFWKFSWDEMAAYDLKSSLDYVVARTRCTKIRYVGFSLGSNKIMALLSTKPEYQKIINSVVLLAPAIYAVHISTALREIAPFITRAADLIGIETFGLFTDSKASRGLNAILCDNPFTADLCLNIIPFITGPSTNEQLNSTRLPVYLSHVPSSISSQVVRHEVQQACNRQFGMFDFGVEENRRRYGRDTPPPYDVESVLTPIFIFYGLNDQMIPLVDVQHFASRVRNLAGYHQVQFEAWSHMDFVWGLQAYKYVHRHVLEYLRYDY